MCPVCNQDMIVVEHGQVELDFCTHCHGVWLDAGELDLLLKCAGLDGRSPATGQSVGASSGGGGKGRKCPICGRRMHKTAIASEPLVVIDACSRGDGLWFDGGEVAQVVRQLAGDQPEERSSARELIAFLGEALKADG